MARQIILVLIRQARARANQAHFASQHIEKLRQFIESQSPQKQTARNESRIPDFVQLRHRRIRPHQALQMSLMHGRIRVQDHRSKLETPKSPPEITHPLLPEENWAR